MHGQKKWRIKRPNQGFTQVQQAFAKTFYNTTIECWRYRHFYTQTLVRTHMAFTLTLLHTDAFTHKHFYTQTLLHTNIFRQRRYRHFKSKKRPFLKPKNRQFAGVSVFFEESRSKKHRKKQCFLTPRKPKTTIFTVFFAPGTKNHGIYSVLWPAPCKNSGIYAVFSMLQEVLFPCQKPKNTVNYSVLAFDARWKTSEKRQKTTKSVQNGASLSTFKNEGSGASFFWALPRQAPASPSQNGPKSEPPPPPHPPD